MPSSSNKAIQECPCSICGKLQPKSKGYSASQWKKPVGVRKCRSCVKAGTASNSTVTTNSTKEKPQDKVPSETTAAETTTPTAVAVQEEASEITTKESTTSTANQEPVPSKTEEEAKEKTTVPPQQHHHHHYVYLADDEHVWIPARVLPNDSSSTSSSGENSLQVSIPQFPSQQAICCNGGTTATKFITKTIPNMSMHQLKLQNVNPDTACLNVVDDMVDLPFLHEPAILYNLKARHVAHQPYTRVGDIVIAVNPFEWLDGLYSAEQQQRYAKALLNHPLNTNNSKSATSSSTSSSSPNPTAKTNSNTNSGMVDPRTTLPPHVYEASCLAYQGLMEYNNGTTTSQNQSILVSGESGAGKTETVKILLQHLASISEGNSTAQNSHSTTHSVVVQRVLDSNPLLEAFGNAQTLRNDNSSRFGKYLQLQFHSVGGGGKPKLTGSHCQVYLLEKSRVVSHHLHDDYNDSTDHSGERTFHIFYQLLAAPDAFKQVIWKDGLVGADNESFDYVGWTPTDTIEGISDADRFQLTLQSLQLMGVTGTSLKMLMRALCIVLQLGNVEFSAVDDDSCDIAEEDEFQALVNLFLLQDENESSTDSSTTKNDTNDTTTNAQAQDVLRKALLRRTMHARSETFDVPLTADFAKDSADALAKEVYASTFLWLVRTINAATTSSSSTTTPSSYHNNHSTTKTIGLLDIFGFETFAVNRFEQLCINYANEKLQAKFTSDIFQSVLLEYEQEGIDLLYHDTTVEYQDNAQVLELVEGRMGLLAFLNEECVRPKGSDKAFVYKAKSMNLNSTDGSENESSSCLFQVPRGHECEFGIHHYAGPVVYDATGMVAKNMDTLPTDLQEAAKLSGNHIVAHELGNESCVSTTSTASTTSKKGPTRKSQSSRRSSTSSSTTTRHNSNANSNPKSSGYSRRSSNIVAQTVWTKFQHQLSALMTTLSDTQTRYIRCIKPNNVKQPVLMDHHGTVEQLRCAGVVAAVTISRSAFPNRLSHEVVLDRFKPLWPLLKFKKQNNTEDKNSDTNPTRHAVDRLLSVALKELETKTDNNGTTVTVKAFCLGTSRAYFRAGALEFLEGQRTQYLGKWAVRIQTMIRRVLTCQNYRTCKQGTLKWQSLWRMYLQRRQFLQHQHAAIQLQSWYRVRHAAQTIYHLRRTMNATKLQTQWRMYVDQKRLYKCRAATIVIQTMVRGALQRPKYRQALLDKKEEAKLERQLAKLQEKLNQAEARLQEQQAQVQAQQVQVVQEPEKVVEPVQQEQKEPATTTTATKQQPMDPAPLSLSADQQALMDESGKMLEYLRKQVFTLKQQNSQLKSDFDLLKDNNQRLMDANASAGASFAALNQHAKQLSVQNSKLQQELSTCKTQLSTLQVVQVELKEELKLKKATYVAEVHSRLQYQRAVQNMAELIQTKSRDTGLVEQVLQLADDCELDQEHDEEHYDGMPSSPTRRNHPPESSSSKRSSSSSIFGYIPFFS